jgi:hypothetical protein
LLDIAGYSNLVLDQQIELTCKPNKIARCAPQFRLGWGGGDARWAADWKPGSPWSFEIAWKFRRSTLWRWSLMIAISISS